MLVELQRLRHDAAQRVGRKIDIGRAGLAAFAVSARDRFVQFLQHQRGLAHGAGIARDRAHQLGVIHVLQAAAIFLRPRIAAGHHEDRRARNMRVGDAGDGVGHAGTGGDQRDAELAGQFRVGLGHMHGGALVAHVDDADAFGIEPHPDRHDVAAAEREHAGDAAAFQEARDQVGGAIGQDFHWTTPFGSFRFERAIRPRATRSGRRRRARRGSIPR